MSVLVAPKRHLNDIWVDLFCGAGGASSGLVESGFKVGMAINHWQTAIDTHSANHPDTEHLRADINHLDMRRLPNSRFLWASVICTEVSPAGGKRQTPTKGQMKLLEYGSMDDAAFVRTRACALDVIRATEVHRYDVIVVENVVDFAVKWELFDWWMEGMAKLGYQSKVVSVSSAHLGDNENEAAAQWRDRIYIVFVRNGLPMPDFEPRPLAYCPECGTDTYARQAWRNGKTIGKYRQQYDYRCERSACRNSIVEPYIVPASHIIDWSRIGQRIGDRTKPLAATTMRKITDGLAEYADLCEPMLITSTHGKDGNARAMPVARAPLPTRTIKIGEGIVTPGAFIAELRGGGSNHRPVTHPLATLSANGNHHCLVIPYRKNTTPKPVSEPMHTISTKDSAGLLHMAHDVNDARYRMVSWREQLNAQRFDRDYIVTGNGGDRTMLAGNAVSVNAARWVGGRIMAALGGAA